MHLLMPPVMMLAVVRQHPQDEGEREEESQVYINVRLTSLVVTYNGYCCTTITITCYTMFIMFILFVNECWQ
jgi:uncharacterized membrane protein